MAIRGIHHIAMHTANFDRQVEFYRRAFGFVPAADEVRWKGDAFIDKLIGVPGSSARTVMLKAGNVYLEVFEYFTPASRDVGPARPNDHGYTHFAVDSDDVRADFERLQEAGMTFVHSEPGELGEIKAVYGKDPDGNVIELQQLKPGHSFDLEALPAVDFGRATVSGR